MDKRMITDAFEEIKWNGWGDTGVCIKYDEARQLPIHTNGKPMKHLLKFMKDDVLKVKGEFKIKPTPGLTKEEAIKRLPPPVVKQPFVDELRQVLSKDQIRLDAYARLTHIFGKNYRDLWRVRRGMIDRPPDAVILPNNHDDCVKIMELAQKHNVVVVPFGGGTNVTGGVEPNPFETRRMVISIDMRRMGRMLHIDTESGTAVFEVGVLGPDIDEQLSRYGFMMGHDPDSYAYSTLGGWIAARGSGAMSNKYGDIENMILAMRVVTPVGVVETPLTSRPCGVDLNAMFVGSEGAFGLVTEAVVKIERIPEVKRYEGWLFPSFEVAFTAFHTCTRKGIHPCTMRLYDEDDTRLSFAASTDSGLVSTFFSKCFKKYIATVKGWNLSKISLVVVGFEGTKAQTNCQRSELVGVFQAFGATCLGTKPGNTWQEKKYDLPYLRDFALAHNFWADVFETSVLYTDAIHCWRAVKKSFAEVMAENGKNAWIGCHTAHQYRFGCCLYFTFIGGQADENDLKIFLQVKKRAMEVMLQHRGNLTHHHGIGYEHVPWMKRYNGEGGLDAIMKFKKALDPKNICNPGKLLPSPPSEKETPKATQARQNREMMFDKMGIPGALQAHL
ncbi:alkyl-dihydroxyacetone phosphate synthase [Trypanosoma equiperdum]|uniref:Alkylglycerone-phosphate synthase n=2 Tax=Trypanozoon TaxID=39700 RepID=Q585R0_TRYB2|nr:alkyl-dihydroxyacetone phosphate synthase [Trypanosoma brucei brucei TREU927]AAX79694.1 alkyl-dihydroxyacetone phosphate synthase [Trypanosoma brucei]AAZ11713.1 alkyl-dihydroxyacetone phosphate synthase [Trypanosoma brucei brucei TREU927]SCU65738.1 alkyl-dihydroxyacetone phosphate synthase [Trypanosoma equiperdum]